MVQPDLNAAAAVNRWCCVACSLPMVLVGNKTDLKANRFLHGSFYIYSTL